MMRDNSDANGGYEDFSLFDCVCAQKGIDAMEDVEKFFDSRYGMRDTGC
jgi:hypothetical protein